MIHNLYDGVVPLPTQTKLPLKKHMRDSTFECTQDSDIRTVSTAAGLGSTSVSLRTAQFTSLETMSAKYTQEMILIPKPSEDQSGGQVIPNTMDQFW